MLLFIIINSIYHKIFKLIFYRYRPIFISIISFIFNRFFLKTKSLILKININTLISPIIPSIFFIFSTLQISITNTIFTNRITSTLINQIHIFTYNTIITRFWNSYSTTQQLTIISTNINIIITIITNIYSFNFSTRTICTKLLSMSNFMSINSIKFFNITSIFYISSNRIISTLNSIRINTTRNSIHIWTFYFLTILFLITRIITLTTTN